MVKFDTYQPMGVLRPYIKRLVISESVAEQTYKVLPDTSLVIGFQYKGRLSQIMNVIETPLSTTGITGLQNQYKVFKGSAHIGTVLVYFNEWGASSFFKNPMHELFGHSVGLDTFLPNSLLEDIQQQLADANTDLQRIQIVERFLVSQLKFTEVDTLVYTAIEKIMQAKGNVRIKELALSLHISQSAFEKRFRKIVGASPKSFASIIRLNTVISYPKNISLTNLGLKAGYYDQAHFIKEFKRFSGETPERFFGQTPSADD